MTRLTQTEITKLHAALDLVEWASACNEITRVRGGDYPPDWYELVLKPNLLEHKFGESGQLRVEAGDRVLATL